jgi:hypothetical protein
LSPTTLQKKNQVQKTYRKALPVFFLILFCKSADQPDYEGFGHEDGGGDEVGE